MMMPVIPPLIAGSSGTPLSPMTSGPFAPKGSCTASEMAWLQEKRNSFTMEELMIFVQPVTTPWDLMVWRPQADVPVPSIVPPK